MAAVTMPLEWHPAYLDKPWLMDWLDRDDKSFSIQIPIYNRRGILAYWDSDPLTLTPRIETLTKRKVGALAPYVGRPFIYVWFVATDSLGRSIAGESWIEYLD